jgi:hypothetical protein
MRGSRRRRRSFRRRVDEVAEAVVGTVGGSLADSVQLLGDLEAQRQAGDQLRAIELEVLQTDRLDVLGLVGAVLGSGDLEADRRADARVGYARRTSKRVA